jgi:hypothetical protein
MTSKLDDPTLMFPEVSMVQEVMVSFFLKPKPELSGVLVAT